MRRQAGDKACRMQLDRLNPPQRQAVLSEAPALLVLAGAGTGKTQVITCRIADFIGRRRVPAQRILAVTFTNKAAAQMRLRAAQLTGLAAEALDVGTFHRICGRILRRYGGRLGLTPGFVIYDADDQLQVLKRCLQATGLDPQQVPPRQLRSQIEGWKNQGLGPEAAAAAPPNFATPVDRAAARIYPMYQAQLLGQNAVDFTDMLLHVLNLCRTDAEALAELQSRWTHILVDEYQDTNPVQYLLIKKLVTAGSSLTVVGDDDQSIYRWRGADIGNILRFEQDFPGAEVIRLEQNYRCTQTILHAANQVIAHNVGRKGKTLFCEGNPGQPLVLRIYNTERDEGQAVAEAIAGALAGGARPADVAILYRTNAQSRPLEEALRRCRIPYRLVGGLRFYDRREIKDALAFLRLTVCPQSDLDFLRVVNLPARGLGKTSLGRLTTWASEQGHSLMEAATELMGDAPPAGMSLTSRARAAVAQFAGQCAAWRRELAAHVPPGRLLEHILQDTGYLAATGEDDADRAAERVENLRELVASLDEYAELSDSPTVAGFLEDVALATEVDRLDDDGGQVALMTLHAAKGLEFLHVMMPGMEEGLFPHSRSLEDRAALEEERRLCYVGLTRAKTSLSLSAARVRSVFGQPQISTLSRFLGEIPREVLDGAAHTDAAQEAEGFVDDDVELDVDAAPTPRRRPAAGSTFAPARRLAPGRSGGGSGGFGGGAAGDFGRGDLAEHATFGLGKVLSVEGGADRRMATVEFAGGLRKVIVTRFLGRVDSPLPRAPSSLGAAGANASPAQPEAEAGAQIDG